MPLARLIHNCERYRRPRAAVAAGSAARFLAFHEQLEMLEWAGHRPDRLGGDTGVERGRVQLGVPEQNLDNTNIDILLEQVGGKAVAQRMRTDTLLDASGFCGLMDSPVDLASRWARESSVPETTSRGAASRRAACPHATRAAAVPIAAATTWHCGPCVPCLARPGSACECCRYRRS